MPFPKKPKFAVVVDGETEFWYLQMLKRNEKQIKFDIKPELPQKKKLQDQYDRVIELSKIYDKVYWIIDLDVILSESLRAKNGKRKPLDILLGHIQKIETKFKNISVIINQPCLEFWFLLHFEKTAKQFANCDEASKRLKNYISDYDKTEKYFTKQDNDIYIRLKPNLSNALINLQQQSNFDVNSPYIGFSEMFKLFEDIEIIK